MQVTAVGKRLRNVGPRQNLRGPIVPQAREWGRSMSLAEAEERCYGTIGGRWCLDYHMQTPIPAKVRAPPNLYTCVRAHVYAHTQSGSGV